MVILRFIDPFGNHIEKLEKLQTTQAYLSRYILKCTYENGDTDVYTLFTENFVLDLSKLTK